MEDKNYSSDSPIYEQGQDRFSRWSFSQRVAQVISKRSDPSSIVIGLYGMWGDGKTSVLNFIEKSLESEDSVICIKFNPWRFGTEDQLLIGFFFDVAEALDAKLIKKSDKLKDIVKKAAPGAAALMGAKGVGDAVGSFISGPDINEFKQRIETELESAKKRILILIDDVDRLEKTEIHTLFKLVRLIADFRYTVYILAFDKDVVATSLQDRYSSADENSGEAFLEKIIQIPLHLPAVEKEVLREFCFQGVEEAISIAGITLSEQQVQEFARNFSTAFDDCLTTPRKAKLYSNILMFSLPILKGEVNPVDLMLLEGIRVFCPSLYEILRRNKALFAGTFRDNYHSNNDSEKEHIRQVINDAVGKCNCADKLGFINLLKNVFPKLQAVYGNTIYRADWHKEWDNGQRICSENYYSRYFTYAIPRGDVPDRVIQEVFNRSEQWSQFLDLESNPLNDVLNPTSAETLIKKLRRQVGEIRADVSRPMAIAISQNSDIIPNPEILYSFTTPFSQAAMLVGELIQNLQKSDRLDLVKFCIDSASSLEFKLEIFRWLRREDENKPEKDAFSEACIEEIGKHLGLLIANLLEDNEDITQLFPKSIPTVFAILNTYLRNGCVNDYVTNLISKDPEGLVRILNAYVPKAWGMESGISHKSDFERHQYNNLTSELDASIVLSSIQNHFPQVMEMDVSKDFPKVHDDDGDKRFLFLQQFVWVHQHVLHESESEGKSHDSEE